MRMMRRMAGDESGATGIEYAAMAFGLGLALLTALPLLRGAMEARLETLSSSMAQLRGEDGPGMRLQSAAVRGRRRELAAAPSAPSADDIITGSVGDAGGAPALRAGTGEDDDVGSEIRQ